jgi:YD repeat-containing protein
LAVLAVLSLEVSAQTTKTLSTEPAYNWNLTSGGGPYETQQDALNARYNFLRSYYRPCFQFSLGNVRVGPQAGTLNGLSTGYVFDLIYTDNCGTSPQSGSQQESSVNMGPACDKIMSLRAYPDDNATPGNLHRYCSVTVAQQDPPPGSCPATKYPVYGETGLKRQSEIDYAAPSSPLEFERTWRSDQHKFVTVGDSNVIRGYSASVYSGRYSSCYAGSYDAPDPVTGVVVTHQYCFPYTSGTTVATMLASPDGNQTFFADDGTTLSPQADINTSITRSTDAVGNATYTVRTGANLLERYGADGLLSSKSWPNGQFVTYTYSSAATPVSVAPRAGLLIGMADHDGRSLSMTYNSTGGIQTLTDPAGGITQYAYDEASANCPASVSRGRCLRLTSVTYPDGTARRYHYNEADHLDSSLRQADAYLTGITDERGTRLSDYRYDSQGRAISSGWGGNNYLLSYGSNQTSVTDPLGSQRTATYQTILGRKRPTGQSQPGGSGCAASSSALSYDANGNVTSKDDFNGSRVCSAYDLSRNLETTRIEGLANTQACSAVTGAGATLPTGSRKVSTAWHPDWRLEAKRADPGKLITSVYNGQPDPFNGGAVANCAPSTALLPDGKPIAVLCKQVEQATGDANGSQGFSATLQAGVSNRVQQWTYNQYGQVLTAKDPLNNLTTYTYYSDATADHTLGDLQTVTNAKNQVTSYSKYNKHGQLLESTDPNGVVTTNTYDLRQRLLSTSVGGQTTSYEYDAAGQLLKVTNPDTSWVGYEYDAAHRQTVVKDNLGNRIEYALDNAGNKTSQSVKDPGGNLARSLARSIDALGRVQQTTGRE